MNGRQGDLPSTQADWSGIGSGLGNLFGQVFGFGGSPAPQTQAQPSPSLVPIIPQALQRATPLPPARPSFATAAPLPPARPSFASPATLVGPAGMTAQPAPGQASLTAPQSAPAVDPNAATLTAAASIPAQLPPASSNFFDQFDPPAPASSTASGGNSAALSAAASIPVQLPAPSAPAAGPNFFDRFDAPSPATAQSTGKPWEKYAPASAATVTRDPWERPTSADTPAPEGPWTRYQTAQPSQPAPAVTRDPWERSANNDDKPWLDYQPAQPVATQQNSPRAWGQASNLDDPYANASLADSAAAIGRTADNAVRNTVDGMTLGYGDKIAAGLDALTGRSPDYASALNAERGQSDRAMAASPGGVGTAEQIAGMALPAGAIGRGAAALGEAASGLPFGLGRLAASPLAQASATGAAVGGINAAGNDQPVAPNAVFGALAGAGGNVLARGAAPMLAGPAATVTAPSTQAIKDTAQAAYGQAFQPGHVIAPSALQRLSGAIRTTLAENAFDPALHPGGMAVVNRIDAFPAPGASATGGPLQNAGSTLQGLDTLRRVAGLMGEGGPSAGRLGGLVQGNVDQFVNGLTPADIVGASNPADSAAALAKARQTWATYSKARDLDDAVAGARAKGDTAMFPGATVDAATRKAVASLRDSRPNWSPDELGALNEVAKGSPTQRALRMVGALAPNSPISALLHAGGLIGGIATGGLGTAGSLGTMATGLAARTAANRLTNSAVANLSNIIRSGGSAPATSPAMGPSVASPLAALLTGSGVNAFQPAQPYAPGIGSAFAQ